MYNSEFFKTVWTKIGQMCGYITCAKSYLSGQYAAKRDDPISQMLDIFRPPFPPKRIDSPYR